MRKKEQIEQSWEVRYTERVGGSAMRLWSRHDSSGEAHSVARNVRADGFVGVTVHRVTRYRLAPLVEIAAWRHYRADGWSRCGTGGLGTREPHAIVSRKGDGSSWAWSVVANGVEVAGRTKTKRAAIKAAEAALAWLGYRVAK